MVNKIKKNSGFVFEKRMEILGKNVDLVESLLYNSEEK